MHTPDNILNIAKVNPIVSAHLRVWKCGEIDWEAVLLSIARDLEEACRELDRIHDLRSQFTKVAAGQFPILDYSLIPDRQIAKQYADKFELLKPKLEKWLADK